MASFRLRYGWIRYTSEKLLHSGNAIELLSPVLVKVVADKMSLIGIHFIQAENGKTELSLVHFTHTNPEWRPPNDAGTYITNLKERAVRDVNLPTLEEENPLFASLNSISSLGNEVYIKISYIRNAEKCK